MHRRTGRMFGIQGKTGQDHQRVDAEQYDVGGCRQGIMPDGFRHLLVHQHIVAQHLDHLLAPFGGGEGEKLPPAGIFVADKRPDHTGYHTDGKQIGSREVKEADPPHGKV